MSFDLDPQGVFLRLEELLEAVKRNVKAWEGERLGV